MTEKPAINLVWLKRDLRLSDHEPLARATHSGLTLIVYIFETFLIEDDHYDDRHWRFVYQSIEDMNAQLAPYNSKVYVYLGDVISCLNEINQAFTIKQLLSYEEIGLKNTYQRDLVVKSWCKEQSINWLESEYAGVIRGKKNRNNWDENWHKVMRLPLSQPSLSSSSLINNEQLLALNWVNLPTTWLTVNKSMLKGGENWANKTLYSFLQGRGQRYHFDISKPLASRTSCSRLSPYLAWGNISLRQFYQTILIKRKEKGWKVPINKLASRLHWHCHFIQKFESEHEMQCRPVNKAYENLHFPEVHCGLTIEERVNKWKTAKTGFPLVDACMICLIETGYLNFRMRAMLVSFLCHHLLVDWRLGVAYLAKLFLDFEPGIHYPQFQMQSGVTGTNAIRVYNPIKQSQDKDINGNFIKKWLPQLAVLPVEIIHTPWELSPMEEQIYDFTLGQTYPHPMVDINETGKIARDLLWGFQKRFDTKKEGHRILSTHVRPPRKAKKAKPKEQTKTTTKIKVKT